MTPGLSTLPSSRWGGFWSAAVAVAGLLAVSPAAAEIRFVARQLGTLGGATSSAAAINEAGEVAGTSRTAALDGSGQPLDHAFLWLPEPAYGLPAGMHDLGSYTGDLGASSGFAISDAGEVVGTSSTGVPGPFGGSIFHAFHWHDGLFTDPGTSTPGFDLTRAREINAAGEIAGTELSGLGCNPVLWLPEPAYGLPAGPNTLVFAENLGEGEAEGINVHGEVVGASSIACDTPNRHAAIWLPAPAYGLPAGPTDLTPDLPLNHIASALAISDSGLVVGYQQQVDSIFLWEPFLWDDGVLTVLPLLPGDITGVAGDVNTQGQVVGSSGTRAVLWEAGIAVDLNDLLPAGSSWDLRSASGINDRGQIVGQGLYQGQLRAFVLDPVIFADGFESGDTSAWSETVP